MAYLLATRLINEHRPHHVGPAIIPASVALSRRISLLRGPGPRRALLCLSVLLVLTALVLAFLAGPNPTYTLNSFHVIDYIPQGRDLTD